MPPRLKGLDVTDALWSPFRLIHSIAAQGAAHITLLLGKFPRSASPNKTRVALVRFNRCSLGCFSVNTIRIVTHSFRFLAYGLPLLLFAAVVRLFHAHRWSSAGSAGRAFR